MDISHLPKEYIKYIEQAEQVILECSSGTNNVYKENFITFLDTMKQRVGAAYDPNYKQVAQEFLERKQLVKKTDKLIKLMDNLDL
jgi:hypothetical protein